MAPTIIAGAEASYIEIHTDCFPAWAPLLLAKVQLLPVLQPADKMLVVASVECQHIVDKIL